MDHFFHYWRCRNNNCNFYHYFSISLNSYDDEGKCILDEIVKKLYSFECKECKTIKLCLSFYWLIPIVISMVGLWVDLSSLYYCLLKYENNFLAWAHSRKILVVVYNRKKFDLVDELIISYLPLQFLQIVIKFFLVNIIQKYCSVIFLDVLSSYRKWTHRFSLCFIEN